MNKEKKELPFIQELLVVLAGDLLEGFELSMDMRKMAPFTSREWYYLRRRRHRRQFEKTLRDAFWRLKKQGCITTQERGKKLMVALTPKGCRRVLREQLRRSVQLPEGQLVLVFFDVPELQQSVRRSFRRLLKESGFWQLQKSVWAIDRDVFEHMKSFIKTNQAEEWVTVCKAPVLFSAHRRKE